MPLHRATGREGIQLVGTRSTSAPKPLRLEVALEAARARYGSTEDQLRVQRAGFFWPFFWAAGWPVVMVIVFAVLFLGVTLGAS